MKLHQYLMLLSLKIFNPHPLPPSLWNTQTSSSLSFYNNTSIHLPTHILTSMAKFIVYNNVTILNLSSISPLDRPFRFTMIWDFYLFSLITSQNFSITFNKVRNNSYPRNPPQNPTTTAAAKHDIYLLQLIPSLLKCVSHPIKESLDVLLVTPKSCFFITLIQNLEHFTNLPNQGPRVGHNVSVKFPPYLAKMLSPIPNTPYPYKLYHAVGALLML